MAFKTYKPTTPGRRATMVDAFDDITKHKPEKKLMMVHKKRTGRSNGRITVRHRGGGTRTFYRLVDFKQQRYDIPATVNAIEYDPNRGARIALIEYADKVKSYILAPQGITAGDSVLSSKNRIEVKTGARMPLKFVPVGQMVHNIELLAGQGGKIVRGAGTSSQLMAVEMGYATLKLPSGELRKVSQECAATIGVLSNPDRNLIRLGKAGRRRHMGWRPSVRGKAMNPVDHPHGGGEGHNPIGMRRPETPQGKPALGVKTRKRKKWSNFLIIQHRK
ncbi:MAG: 50S ribosomal protein L2 [Candidatus Magasanikbacteria bacterium]|nr:50S ribosomal protein L2 [Candidatus Magasanikbacteria bacterium]